MLVIILKIRCSLRPGESSSEKCTCDQFCKTNTPVPALDYQCIRGTSCDVIIIQILAPMIVYIEQTTCTVNSISAFVGVDKALNSQGAYRHRPQESKGAIGSDGNAVFLTFLMSIILLRAQLR